MCTHVTITQLKSLHCVLIFFIPPAQYSVFRSFSLPAWESFKGRSTCCWPLRCVGHGLREYRCLCPHPCDCPHVYVCDRGCGCGNMWICEPGQGPQCRGRRPLLHWNRALSDSPSQGPLQGAVALLESPCRLTARRLVSKATTPVAIGTQARVRTAISHPGHAGRRPPLPACQEPGPGFK